MRLTTNTPYHCQHRPNHVFEVGVGQTELPQRERANIDVNLHRCGRFIGWPLRRRFTHDGKGCERNGITKKSSALRKIFFVTTIVCGVLLSRATFAHDAPPIAPTRLDFDTTQAPKNCNDEDTFRRLLTNWVIPGTLTPTAERRLVVRIRRSPTGGKLVDVTLLDAGGATLGQDHKTFPSKVECHNVLYEAAQDAARLMGAFEKPPTPEPTHCPTCPAPAEPLPCRVPGPPTSRIIGPVEPSRAGATSSAPARRAFLGAGVFLGTGFTSELAVGPLISLGFVPSSHSPRFHIEIDGAWLPQIHPKSNAFAGFQVHAFPLFGSVCYSRDVLRICSGMVMTFFNAERADLLARNDSMRVTLAGTLRLGTEFTVSGPFSIRADAYALLRFWQRTNGPALAALDELSPFGQGAVIMGVWSFD
jgi:hypothetical protein